MMGEPVGSPGLTLADDCSDVGVSNQPHECDEAKTKSPKEGNADVGNEGVFHGLVSFWLPGSTVDPMDE